MSVKLINYQRSQQFTQLSQGAAVNFVRKFDPEIKLANKPSNKTKAGSKLCTPISSAINTLVMGS